MNEIEKKAYCNLYVAYFTLTEEIDNLIRYSNEIETKDNIEEVSYKTGIILNKILSVNTILYNTFAHDLFELYKEKKFADVFETGLFNFVLYLRNFIVHEGFYKIRVIPEVRIEIKKDKSKYQIFKIMLSTEDLAAFLVKEMARKPMKRELINKAKKYVENYENSLDITEELMNYYNELIKLYRLFESNVGMEIVYLK